MTPITIFTANAIIKDEDLIEVYTALRLPEITVSDPITSQELALYKTGLSEYLRSKMLDIINPYIDSRVAIKQNEARALLHSETEQSISVNITETTLENLLNP